jgi:hypothetical protein
MVQRAVTFRIPAAQRELLGAGQAEHPISLCRHAHPRETVEKLLGLKVGGTKFEAGGDVLPVDVHDTVEPRRVQRPHHQHPDTERRGARRPDLPVAVYRELGARLCLVRGRDAVEKELLSEVRHRPEVGEGKRERPPAPPARHWTGHYRVRRHQCWPLQFPLG